MKGIYQITNLINGHSYVGLSNHMSRRFMEHKTPKNIRNKTNVLYKAIRKYGIENFNFVVIEYVKDIDLLAEREMFWISIINPEYNMNKGGNGNLGRSLTEEQKSVLRIAGIKQWEKMSIEEREHRKKTQLIGPKKGHSVTEETREKLRLKNLGKKQSEQTKSKRSSAMKHSALGNQNGNKAVIRLGGRFNVEYPSIVAAAKEIGVHPGGITRCIKGSQATCGGYKWKLHNK